MITLLDWQRLYINWIANKVADIFVLAGGFGSGKTAVNTHTIDQLYCMGLTKGLAIAPTATLIRDTIAESIEEEIPETFIKRVDRSQQMKWEFDFEGFKGKLLSRGIQYGHEAGRRVKSINADFLWLVEATELPREAYTVGLSRLRSSRGEQAYYPVLIETNPSSKSNWVYKNFIEGSDEIYRDPSDDWWITLKTFTESVEGEDREIKCVVFHTKTMANPHFPRSQIAQMKATYSPGEYQRLILGEWNAMEGRVWEAYHLFEHPKGTHNQIAFAQLFDNVFIGVDPGQDHPTAIVFIGFKGGAYYVFDEYVKRDKSIRHCYNIVVERLETWGLQGRPIQLYIDPSGRQWKKEWNVLAGGEGGLYRCTSSTHRGTDPALNRALKLGEMLRTKRLMVSDTLCPNVISDMEQTQYKKGSEREKIDKQEHDPHAMDAVGYAIQKVAP